MTSQVIKNPKPDKFLYIRSLPLSEFVGWNKFILINPLRQTQTSLIMFTLSHSVINFSAFVVKDKIMGWFSGVIGGGLGAMLAGPFGAIIGAAIGAGMENAQNLPQ
jgi:hypothetical protein